MVVFCLRGTIVNNPIREAATRGSPKHDPADSGSTLEGSRFDGDFIGNVNGNAKSRFILL
jgi:hypothetical protein